jgi:hypothetical protein
MWPQGSAVALTSSRSSEWLDLAFVTILSWQIEQVEIGINIKHFLKL